MEMTTIPLQMPCHCIQNEMAKGIAQYRDTVTDTSILDSGLQAIQLQTQKNATMEAIHKLAMAMLMNP